MPPLLTNTTNSLRFEMYCAIRHNFLTNFHFFFFISSFFLCLLITLFSFMYYLLLLLLFLLFLTKMRVQWGNGLRLILHDGIFHMYLRMLQKRKKKSICIRFHFRVISSLRYHKTFNWLQYHYAMCIMILRRMAL